MSEDKWILGVVPTVAADVATTPNEIVLMQTMVNAELPAQEVTLQALLAATTSGGGSGGSSGRVESLWTDNSNAFYVRIDTSGTITWTNVLGVTSAAPGTGIRPVGGTSAVITSSTYQVTTAATGYAVGDILSHIVTTDPVTGAVIGFFWVNITQNTTLGSAPASGNISPISPLPTGASTAANQATGNASLATIATQTAALGTTADTSATSDTGTFSLVALTKRLLAKMTAGLPVWLSDGVGNAITSSTLSGKQRLDVNLAAGAVPGTMAPAWADQAAGVDGSGNLRALLTDTSGRQSVNVNALPATTIFTGPTGLSALNTDLLSGTVNGWYDAINYREAIVQVIGSAGITGGVVSFEQTNDTVNAPSGVVSYYYEIGASTAPATNATIGASAVRVFTVKLACRYFRVRISTAFSGGTVQANVNFSAYPARQESTSLLPTALTTGVIGTVLIGNTANTTPILSKISDGTNAATIKAASTAAVAADPSLVVASSPISAPANSVGVATIATGQNTSIGTSAGLIVNNRTGVPGTGRVFITIYNQGTVTVYVGISTVTPATGLPILPGGSKDIPSTASIYGIVASGTGSVAYMEHY